jgi:hypothetical protein
METRRIRRHERRRIRRTAVMATSMAMIGVAAGNALPQSTTASLALLAAAVCCLALVAMRDPSRAPLHGLHRVVRLPLRTSLGAMVESFTSRLVGTLHAVFSGRLQPTPLVLDEPDDEAEEWWGAMATPRQEPLPVPLAPWPPARPPAAPLPAPVLAAPMASAHVPSQRTRSIGSRIAPLGTYLRRGKELLAKHHRRSTDGAGAST